MEQDRIMRIEYEWHNPYRVTLGDADTRFLEGLKQKKIFGNVCHKCGGLYVPARSFCDRCLEIPTEWVETDSIGTLVTYTITYEKFLGLPDPPYITGIINVGNSVTNFLHFVSGVDYKDPKELETKMRIGMKLKPVWKENRIGDILDIAYFSPI